MLGRYQSLYPSVVSTLSLTAGELLSIGKGDEFVWTGIKNIAKNGAGLINNTSKMYNKGLFRDEKSKKIKDLGNNK